MSAIRPRSRIGIVLAALSALALAVAGPASAHGGGKGADVYKKRNLVSDIDGVARITDANLVNPWGLAFGPATPAWVSDNGMDVSTLYSGRRAQEHPRDRCRSWSASPAALQPGWCSTPPAASRSAARRRTSSSTPRPGRSPRGTAGTQAVTEATTPEAVYKGLAIASKGSATMLYAANFHTGKIDVFNDAFAPVTVPGGFADPNLPAGFAPFNVQEIAGRLVVAFAQQDPNSADELHGPGLGYVDVFDTSGHLLRRLVSQGPLNAPWGLAVAPRHFGPFSGDLLVGNFGDGRSTPTTRGRAPSRAR